MSAIAEVTDQATATASLEAARRHLNDAVDAADDAIDALRARIVALRPSGVLTVDEMAKAIGRDRNYVDSVWSAFGEVTPRKQTRVPLTPLVQEERDQAFNQLAILAHASHSAAGKVIAARSLRDRTVALVYASKLLGPSSIAAHVGVDRNHVLRIARRQGVGPAHRAVSRNQYSAPFETTAE